MNILNKVMGVGLAALLLTACTDTNDWTVDSSKARLFAVANSDITIERDMSFVDVAFKTVKGAQSYTMEISTDELNDNIEEGGTPNSRIFHFASTEAVDSKISTTISELKKDTRYYLRIRSDAEGQKSSKWTYYKDSKNNPYFKTKAEQLFSTYTYFAQKIISPKYLKQDEVELHWKADEGSEVAAVTNLILQKDGQEVANITLSAEDIAARQYNLKYADYGIEPNTTFTALIYNSDDKRGKLDITTPKALPEGIHILQETETIESLINSATSDIVIGVPGTENADENPLSVPALTIPNGVSVTIYGLPGGFPRLLNFKKPINIAGQHNLIRFDNVKINDDGCQYLVNQSSGCDVGSFEFENVTIPKLTRSLIRFNSSDICKIGKLSLDYCYINNQGTGGYALLYGNKDNYTISETYISNSTFSNLAHSFIDFSNASVQSINMDNVTFYNIIGSDRYFIDSKNTQPVFNINRCIFAKTYNNNAKGIRCNDTEKEEDYITYTFGNCYMTSDFIFKTDPAAQNKERTGRPFYAGSNVSSSSKIFKAPKENNFTIADATVQGGDPRWIQNEEE